MKEDQVQEIIINSLKFHDIPLTYKELYELLVYDGMKGKVLQDTYISGIDQLKTSKQIVVNDDYVGLFGNIITEQVALRTKKENYLRERRKDLSKLFEKFNGSQKIHFIGVSGKLVKEDEKIDVFVTTTVDYAWIARFLVSKKIGKQKGQYKFDSFTEEKPIPFERGSLYAAKELLSLKQIVNNDKAYENIIGQNLWAFDYFPNYPLEKISFNLGINNTNKNASSTRLDRFLNKQAMRYQKKHYDNEKYDLSLNQIRRK